MKAVYLFLCLLISYKSNCQNLNLVVNGNFGYYIRDTDISFSNCIIDTEANKLNHCWFRATNRFSEIFACRNLPLLLPFMERPFSDSNALRVLCFVPLVYKISTSTFDTVFIDSFRTYAQTKLAKPLESGKNYVFSMYIGGLHADTINLSGGYNDNTVSNIGVLFSNSKVAEYANMGQLQLSPQLNFKNYTFPSIDSFSYLKLSATYIAQGGEQFLTIGNFDSVKNFVFNNISKHEMVRDTITYGCWQSYLIDDVTLVEYGNGSTIIPDVFSLGNDTLLCDGKSITLSAPKYYTNYYWNTGDTTQNIIVNKPGIYYCSASFGCTDYSDSISVKMENNPPINFLDNDGIICNGGSIQLNAPSTYHCLWNTSEQSSSISVSQEGLYYCTITNDCGISSDSIFLSVKPCEIFFPNAFSPNNDGINDNFKPIAGLENIIDYSVYNRFGNCVFNTNNSIIGWDGKYQSVDCSIGTYYFVCRYKFNNREKILKGDVELIR